MALYELLDSFRSAAATEREKGTYFEELVVCYLTSEPAYASLYCNVWTYGQWAALNGLKRTDAGIDLVAQTAGTNELHAIQCKLYAEDYKLKKSDIDSFFTASGKKPFVHRIIIATTNEWSEHAEDALRDQQPPVSKIDLHDLESSQVDWARYSPKAPPPLRPRKIPRPHQVRAVRAAVDGLAQQHRGKLIMACGTGKTFTSLRIAEEVAGVGGRVLFLVPSLSLLSQSLTEWTHESTIPLLCFAVCSDADIGKKRTKSSDAVQTFTHELRYPATTNPARLGTEVAKRHDENHLSVVFATYHSIDVLAQAQRDHGLPPFDLIVCDEAHRTTGATFDDEDESHFVRVHDGDYIRGGKRLYMTATPRVYGELAKASAEQGDVALFSMDDEALFGQDLHVITFSEAVTQGLLVDYKVIVLAVEESHVNRRLQSLLADDNNQLKVDDAARIIGCWKALSRQGLSETAGAEQPPLQRAVAFCQVIETTKGSKTHKTSSKNIAEIFQQVIDAYQASVSDTDEDRAEAAIRLRCEAAHVDGGMNASEREAKLAWLKGDVPDQTCRILSNVRCLSEGVDVPALDAVLFLSPRNSPVDVVQSVGRVMRNAPGKKLGYVVLPVVIPAGVEPHVALNDNKTYRVIWQVLQALRSHDDRFDAMINKLDLIGSDKSKMEVIAITEKVAPRVKPKEGFQYPDAAKGTHAIGEPKAAPYLNAEQEELGLDFGILERAIYAKLVQKVGNRHHWEDWANDIAKIARTHIDRIQALLNAPANERERAAFKGFADELRDDLNDSISDAEVIEMLAQHLITKPVFEALFEGYGFATRNPISMAMQGVLDVLQEHRLDKEANTLDRFYASVRMRAQGIDSAAGKQKIMVELYDKFFRNAFPKMTDRLGIVYTPIEVVDFIIRSVDDVLTTEFGQSLGSPGVHIIDPFTGTGTFITRLIQSGLLTPEQLRAKYNTEIHANEIVLLAYYLAAINIESAYHDAVGGEYAPFEGICLTDTFQLYEKDDLISSALVDNSARRNRQKQLDIRVIVGNPPYSVGQGNANENNQNVGYASLDERIRETYGARSATTNRNSLFDSYIRAIRWASDRLGKSGVIGFVTNAGFIDSGTAAGLRQCLAEEFSSLYIVHLRGNQRTSGELSRREGGKIFGSGSRAPIAISVLVKNPASKSGQIHFFDIGDYLSREQKLEKLTAYASIKGLSTEALWRNIVPDSHGDWINIRDERYADFIVAGDKDESVALKLFASFSNGVKTQRDAWCYNFSRATVSESICGMIDLYAAQSRRLQIECPGMEGKELDGIVDQFVSSDGNGISWTRALRYHLARHRQLAFNDEKITCSLYRPFSKQWLYYDRTLNEMIYRMPRIFPPTGERNRAIMVKQGWHGEGHLALMVDCVGDLQPDGGAQYFPLYLYEPKAEVLASGQSGQGQLFSESQVPPSNAEKLVRHDAITDVGLAHVQSHYPSDVVSREEVFYYFYGLLYSTDYRERFAENLGKELPRIPCVKQIADFRAFSAAGRVLAELHLHYESQPMWQASVSGDNITEPPALEARAYRVEKMRFGKLGGEKDRSVIHYNDRITVSGIPLEAYAYVVNGKPAIEWVMERQSVRTDKASGIVNDANDWATETVGNPRYPLELLLRVITVSIETMRIVAELPKLDI